MLLLAPPGCFWLLLAPLGPSWLLLVPDSLAPAGGLLAPPGFRSGPARCIFHVEGRVQDKTSGARRIQKDPGAGKSQEKPGGGVRGSQNESGGTRRSQEEPGCPKRIQEDPGGPNGDLGHPGSHWIPPAHLRTWRGFGGKKTTELHKCPKYDRFFPPPPPRSPESS